MNLKVFIDLYNDKGAKIASLNAVGCSVKSFYAVVERFAREYRDKHVSYAIVRDEKNELFTLNIK